MALALYRKYRPASFAEVIGQEHVTEPLRTALAAGRINHAYLFSGPRGCGKTSSARILARSLNCVLGPTPDPCGVCPSCIALAPEGPGSLDVVELDAASHGGVDDTRDLRDKAFYMPAESRYRVFIIDEAHMVTPQGFNALLKIVEEPPEHLVFIFATTEPDKVLTTIRSRTHHYPFRLIPPATLRALLERLCTQEGVTVEPAVFPLVIRAGGGSARDSLSVLDQLLAGAGSGGVTYQSAVALLGVTDAALLDETVDALAAADGASVFGAVDKVVEAGHDPRRFAQDLLQRLRDLVILAAVPEAADKGLIDAPDDQVAAMSVQAGRLGAATASRFAELLHTGLIEMRGTTAPRLTLELMCARMLLPAATLSDGALLQRLERIERRMVIATEPAVPPTQPIAPPEVVGRTMVAPVVEAAPVAHPDPPAPVPGAVPLPTNPPPGASRDTGRTNDLGLPPPPTLSGATRRSVPSARRGTADGEAATSAAGTGERGVGVAARATDIASTASTASETSIPPDTESHRGSSAEATPAGATPAEASDRSPAPDLSASSVTDTRPASTQPPPTQPAANGAPDGVDVTDVRRVWTEILAAVQRRRRTTQILLESATVSSAAQGALVLTMPSAGMARRVVEPANADLLRSALTEVLGVNWVIRCETTDAGNRAAPATPAAPAAARSVTAVRRDSVPPPPEPDPMDEEIPDDYGDPAAPVIAVRDPAEVAIELLTSELGARPLDDDGDGSAPARRPK